MSKDYGNLCMKLYVKSPHRSCDAGILHGNCIWKTSFPSAISGSLSMLLLQHDLLTLIYDTCDRLFSDAIF